MQCLTTSNCFTYAPLGLPWSNKTPPPTTDYQKNPPVSICKPQTIKSFSHLNKGASIISEDVPLPLNPKLITSTSNPFVKHCVKLRQNSSYRHSHRSVLLVGTTLIREILEFHKLNQEQQLKIECVFLLDKAEVPEEICDAPGERVQVSHVVMKKLSGVQSTESIDAIALIRIPHSFLNLNDEYDQSDIMDSKRWFPCLHRILVLEGIQDPGNLGTLLRSALAFKWNGVFLLPGCCDPFNEKAIRASRGASFQLPLVSGTWTHLEALKHEVQMKMLAGHPDSNNARKPVLKLSTGLANSLADTPLCLVLGSEGSGLSVKAKELCELVSIPISEHFESLNVAVAGGIFMFVLKSDNPQS